MITVIKTNKMLLKDFPIVKDNFLYTLDTHETFFDLNENERMQIKTGIQCRDEAQLFATPNPSVHKVYISLKSNKIYRFFEGKFVEIKDRSQIVDLLIHMTELKPVVLSEGDSNIAPRTLMSQIFSDDGRNLEEILEERNKDKYTFIFTKEVTLEAEMDYQKVFTIPFPIPAYDIKKFPIQVIFGDNEYVRPSEYAISKNQLIFGESFANRIVKGNLISLIFYYSESIMYGDSISANKINGRFVLFSDNEPVEMQIGDIWFNTSKKMCLEYTADGWKDILNPEDIDILEFTTVISSQEMEILIPDETFDKTKDALDVYRNGLMYINNIDYEISEDSRSIKRKEPDTFVIPNEMHTYLFRITKNGLPRDKGITLATDTPPTESNPAPETNGESSTSSNG